MLSIFYKRQFSVPAFCAALLNHDVLEIPPRTQCKGFRSGKLVAMRMMLPLSSEASGRNRSTALPV
jgi:hypothetical protein